MSPELDFGSRIGVKAGTINRYLITSRRAAEERRNRIYHRRDTVQNRGGQESRPYRFVQLVSENTCLISQVHCYIVGFELTERRRSGKLNEIAEPADCTGHISANTGDCDIGSLQDCWGDIFRKSNFNGRQGFTYQGSGLRRNSGHVIYRYPDNAQAVRTGRYHGNIFRESQTQRGRRGRFVIGNQLGLGLIGNVDHFDPVTAAGESQAAQQLNRVVRADEPTQ